MKGCKGIGGLLSLALILGITPTDVEALTNDYTQDIAEIAARYNLSSGDEAYDSKYDLNSDDIIDLYDLVLTVKEEEKDYNLDNTDVSNLNSTEQYWWYTPNTTHDVPTMNQWLPFDISQYKYKYVGDTSRKVIYLTFDTEYKTNNVETILNVLNENDVKANFFVISNFVDYHPDLLKKISDNGNQICNHSSSHNAMTSIVGDKQKFQSEIKDLEKKVKEITGKDMAKYFRAPEGRYSEQTLKYVEDLGYTSVFWSFNHNDWNDYNQPQPDEAKKDIISHFHNGEIMLLHAASDTNAAILDDVIKEAKAQGYTFELL